jgi:hypothetical protein
MNGLRTRQDGSASRLQCELQVCQEEGDIAIVGSCEQNVGMHGTTLFVCSHE